MSLFEDENYTYRDTFFIHFDSASRPTGEAVQRCIAKIDDKYEIENLRENDGKFESITIRSPHDSSAMDIIFVQGDEVTEQVEELVSEFRDMTLTGDELSKLKSLKSSSARFDIFHFEQKSAFGGEDMLDPGGLFLVMEKLAAICDGVGIDPQSRTLL